MRLIFSFALIFFLALSIKSQTLRFSIERMAILNKNDFEFPEFIHARGLLIINVEDDEIIVKTANSKNIFEILSLESYQLNDGAEIDEILTFDYDQNEKREIRLVKVNNPNKEVSYDLKLHIVYEKYEIIYVLKFL